MVEARDLKIVRSASVERIELGDGSSWVDFIHGFVADPDELLALVSEQTEWMQGETWRYERYVKEHRLGAWVDPSANDAIRQTTMHLESRYHVRFVGVTAILYRDGEDFQGLHADREMKWLDETLIAILVLGEPRPFRLKPRSAAPDDRANEMDLWPGRGDLIVLGGRCQRDWLHGVPAFATGNPRVSLTWRWTSRRGRPDTAPSYFEGRHYSGRRTVPGHRLRRPDG